MPAGDLCTLSDLTSYLGDTNITGPSLTALSFLITQVSGWVQGYCEAFLAGPKTYTWITDGNAQSRIFLTEGPVTGITSATAGGSALPISSGSPAYGLVNTDCEAVFIGGRFPRGDQNITIVYTAGYPYTFTAGQNADGTANAALDTLSGTPGDLRWAVIETVALRFKRRQSLGKNSEGLTGQTTSYDNNIAPKDAMQTFGKYKKGTPW